jgi:hypothetical protein
MMATIEEQIGAVRYAIIEAESELQKLDHLQLGFLGTGNDRYIRHLENRVQSLRSAQLTLRSVQQLRASLREDTPEAKTES